MIHTFIQDHKLPSYREAQFYQAFYRDFIRSLDELSTWSQVDRKCLETEVPFSSITRVKQTTSKSVDTSKVLFRRLSDQKLFESVLMRHQDGRNTVCVSCMVGCPVACEFCATGRLGFQGSLSSREIVDQILYFCRLLKEEHQTVTNIVFMGMGEPLLTLPSVEEALSVISDPSKMGFSERRITISTSGIISGLYRLIDIGYRGRLALSLHAPNQQLRERIMPIAIKNPLSEILPLLTHFAEMTNKRISYEYILIDRLNDQPEHAKELARLLDPRLSHVNLIPYNSTGHPTFNKSKPGTIYTFASILKKYQIPHTIRVTMGDDIKAACGQLAANIV